MTDKTKDYITIMVFPGKYALRVWKADTEEFVWSRFNPLPEGPSALEDIKRSLEVVTGLGVDIDMAQAEKLTGQFELDLDDLNSAYWGERECFYNDYRRFLK